MQVAIILSVFITVLIMSIMIFSDINKDKKRSKFYYLIFALIFLVFTFLFFKTKLNASDVIFYNFIEHAKHSESFELKAEEEIALINARLLIKKDAIYFDQKINYHKKEGQKAFNAAQETCRWIPDTRQREVAINIFRQVLQTSVAAGFGGWPGLVSSLIITLGEYGIYVYEQGEKIKTSLQEAEYHFTMMTYYAKKKEESGS